MTTGLLLPERLAKQKVAKQLKEEHSKLPTPTGWRILIMPYNPPTTTKGGIELPDAVHERERVGTVAGLVLKVGPLAYKDKSKFGDPSSLNDKLLPWCKEKDWVLFSKYAGSRFKIEGGELRILNDDEVLGIIDDPSNLIHT